MISVLNWCFSRQEQLDITLPKILAQEGVDLEVVLGIGPRINLSCDPRVVHVKTNEPNLCKAYNALLRAAKGDVLFITQCDIDIRQTDFLKAMLSKWSPSKVVTEQFWKHPHRNNLTHYVRDTGLHLQSMMVSRQAMLQIGGWHEPFSDKSLLGYEDVDIMTSLLERGLSLEHTQSDVHHLPHSVNYWDKGMKAFNRRVAAAKALYNSRHPMTPAQLLQARKASQAPQRPSIPHRLWNWLKGS